MIRSLGAAVTLAILSSLSLLTSTARADLITSLTAEVTPTGQGTFLYRYSLTNEPASDLPAIAFLLTVAEDANLHSLAGPLGWVIGYTQGDTLVSWASPASPADLLPGAIATFSFVSPLPPAVAEFGVLGFDDATLRFESHSGLTVAPAQAVPEPLSALLFGVGLSGLIGVQWLRRKRTWTPGQRS